MTFYNENDPKAAAWLRELIRGGHIAGGVVDERSIIDLQPGDLAGFTRCHFFAGIGGWDYALRLAGWPEDRPIWTGSCPCQPFSGAGLGKGHADERHLWPAFYRLIAECKPATIFGEQVASSLGREWLAGVRADLERMGYAVGSADLCAAGVGAPHIRQRLYWVADTKSEGRKGMVRGHEPEQRERAWLGREGAVERLDDAACARCGWSVANAEGDSRDEARMRLSCESSDLGGVVHADSGASETRLPEPTQRQERIAGVVDDASSPCGAWDSYDLLPCTDGKARRTQSGLFPLAHGVSGRVGLLRGYGNAIVPQVAAEFIEAAMRVREWPKEKDFSP